MHFGAEELKGLENPLLDVRLLLMHVTGMDKIELMLSSDMEVDEEDRCRFSDLIRSRKAHCPIAYLIGEKEFYGRSFSVERGVLIPRGDTELLVESVLERIKSLKCPKGFEVGVGSGAISVTLLCEREDLTMVSSDIEETPIRIARENAMFHNVGARLHLHHCSLFDELDEEKFDFIVSNPPYIDAKEMEELMKDVFDYEPHTALFGGEDGLFFYHSIVNKGRDHLREGGFFAFEIGWDQADQVVEICHEYGLTDTMVKKDLAGRDRAVIARKEM